jgi:hypothetical protein
MISKTQVVVGAEVDDLPTSLDFDIGILWRCQEPFFFVQTGFVDIVENCLKNVSRCCKHR